jgi:membrane protein
MSNPLRRAAPLLVLAGLALMPKADRARRAASPEPEPAPAPAPPQLNDRPTPERNVDPGEAAGDGRGRHADAPHQIPRKGWKDILIRTWKEYNEDQIPLVSAGVTFYALLAIFPGLGAFAALYGLFADVADAQKDLQTLSIILPGDALKFFGAQMVRLSEAHTGGLSLAFLLSLALSIWSANGAVKAIMTALNIAFDETETRGYVHRTVLSLGITVGFTLLSMAIVVGMTAPAALEPFIGEASSTVLGWITWPVLILVLGLALALVYRYGPSRDNVRWRWISWGSVSAVALWATASAAFSAYVANFAHYDRTYGPLGAAVGFMMWVYVSAQVALLGAELNSEIEHQTMKDTTVGPEQPLGRRGATMADTVGAPQGS